MPKTAGQQDLYQGVKPGMEVLGSDAQKLGTVDELAVDRFKVDVFLGRDYWLLAQHIQFVDHDENRLMMEFGQSETANFKVDAPV